MFPRWSMQILPRVCELTAKPRTPKIVILATETRHLHLRASAGETQRK